MFVKICGITSRADAELAIGAGANALGFNFWPHSQRYIDRPQKGRWIRELPATIERVGLLVNPSWDEAREVAAMDGIDSLQLHGAESPEFCARLQQVKIRFAKAIPVSGAEFANGLSDYHTERLILDSSLQERFGGTGVPFQWDWARRFIAANRSLQVIVAGGLTPENVAEAIHVTKPFGVDVTSGVECAPGRKDPKRLREFIAAAQAA